MDSPFSSPEIPAPRRRRWVVPLVIIGVLCLPPLISVTWFLHYRSSGSSAVEKLEAAIKARGEPLTLADLAAMYPPIPDSSNGAAALLNVWEKDSPAFWAAFREGSPTLPPRSFPQVDRELPFFGANARRIPRTGGIPSASLAAAESYLAQQKEHIAAVRAALRLPQFRFPIQITNGFTMLLPHLSEIRREAQNFRVHALVAMEHGDTESAITDLEDMAGMGRTLSSEPTLISQLVRMACNGMVLEDMERLLSRGPLTEAQISRMERLLDRIQMTGALQLSFESERASDVSAFNLPADKLAGMVSPPGGDGSDNSAASGLRTGMGFLSAIGLKDADERLILETMGEAIGLAGREDPEAISNSEAAFRNAAVEARKFPPKIFSSMLLPALEKVPSKFAAFEARRRAAVAGLAVERYRMNHEGRLPERLDDLTPQFIPSVPTDPFDGNELRFERLPTGFVVYSIGADRVDDGGKERPQRGTARSFDETFTVDR